MEEDLNSEARTIPVGVDRGQLMTDINDIGIDITTISLVDNGTSANQTRDISIYDRMLEPDSSDDEDEECTDNDDRDTEENDYYVVLEDDHQDDEFTDFVTAEHVTYDSWQKVESPNDTMKVESNQKTTDPFTAKEINFEDIISTTETESHTQSNIQIITPPNIPPLDQAKINSILSTMKSLNLTPRPLAGRYNKTITLLQTNPQMKKNSDLRNKTKHKGQDDIRAFKLIPVILTLMVVIAFFTLLLRSNDDKIKSMRGESVEMHTNNVRSPPSQRVKYTPRISSQKYLLLNNMMPIDISLYKKSTVAPITSFLETDHPITNIELFQTDAKPRQFLSKESIGMHFIHIPKCGGTSMTAVLREMMCADNTTKNTDCCTNPGFCDWHAFRRCAAIKGCSDHFPNRIISAWFYRCHTPNDDCFQVRPYFKQIKQGLLPKVDFAQYIEMNEYQNIQTRMLGADSFPYRNVTVDDQVFQQAVDALTHIDFIGLQEFYEISVHLLLREYKMTHLNIQIHKERDQSSDSLSQKKMLEDKKKLKANTVLLNRAKEINVFDRKLYQLGVHRFCHTLSKYPDLWKQAEEESMKKSLKSSPNSLTSSNSDALNSSSFICNQLKIPILV